MPWTFAVVVDSPLGVGLTTITNTASITAAASDPDANNNTAEATTPVTASVALHATLDDALTVDHDNDGQADPGDMIAYTATVSNTGDQDAADVVYRQMLDGYTALDCNSVMVSSGRVVACTDGAGGAFSVELTSEAGGSKLFKAQTTATITFEALVSGSLPETLTAVWTQGTVEYTSGTTTETFVTDDPSTVSLDDATATEVDPSSGIATSVEEVGGVPVSFALESNYPNPFNPQTTIPYAVPEMSEVRLMVYDVTGRQVAVLVEGRVPAGRHEVEWQARDLPSGVYLVRLQAGSFSQVRRMTLVK